MIFSAFAYLLLLPLSTQAGVHKLKLHKIKHESVNPALETAYLSEKYGCQAQLPMLGAGGKGRQMSSSTRPKAGTASSASSSQLQASGWKAPAPTPTPSAAGAGTGRSPSGAGTGSYTNNSPLSKAEWQGRQAENVRRQHGQFERDAAREEAQHIAQAAAAAMDSMSAQDEMSFAWSAYKNSWVSLGARPALFFRSLPWPVLRAPSSPEDLNTKAIGTFVLSPVHLQGRTPRYRLKDQLSRWHPDRFENKWLPRIADPEERELVRHGAGQVVRSLNELMGNVNKDIF